MNNLEAKRGIVCAKIKEFLPVKEGDFIEVKVGEVMYLVYWIGEPDAYSVFCEVGGCPSEETGEYRETSEGERSLNRLDLCQHDSIRLASDLLDRIRVDSEWVSTDDGANQWGRLIGHRVYEFKQDMKYPNKVVITEEEEINLGKYTDDEINRHLSPYGWDMNQLMAENSLDDAEWLMAECIFEQIAH